MPADYAERVPNRSPRVIAQLTLPAAVDALGVLAFSFLPLLAGGLLAWVVEDRLQPSLGAVWSRASRLWLLALGVPLHVDGGALTAGGQVAGYAITLAPTGLTAFVLWLVWRAAGRCTGRALWPSWLGFGIVIALGTLLLVATSASATGSTAWPEAWVIPLAVTLAVFVATSILRQPADTPERRAAAAPLQALRRLVARRAEAADVLASGWRAAWTTMLALATAGAVGLGVSILLHWMDLISVSEALAGGWTGATLLAALQLVWLPTAVIWAMAWLSGVGVVVGTGSLLAPAVAQAAPLPAIPLLAALPSGVGWQWALLAVPVGCGMLGALLGLRGLARDSAPGWRGWATLALGCLWQAVAATLIMAVLVWLASGAIGPGRLQEVGPAAGRLEILTGLVLLGGLLVAVPARLRPPAAAETE